MQLLELIDSPVKSKIIKNHGDLRKIILKYGIILPKIGSRGVFRKESPSWAVPDGKRCGRAEFSRMANKDGTFLV
jgi:hypothetical protein